jgi:hypothetical protein
VAALLLVTVAACVVVLQARSSTSPALPAPTCPTVAAGLHADVDGDGCDDALRFDAGVLDAVGVRARLGQPGDVVAAGRWTCGPATLALLRPATGEVFRFGGWARPGQDVTAVRVATIAGAAALQTRRGRKVGCDDLEVTRATGTGSAVRLRAPVAG